MLSKAATKIIRDMLKAEEAKEWDDAEIVREGRCCYLGYTRISSTRVDELLRLALLHDDGEDKGVERYSLNEDGRAMAKDENYVPTIVRASNSAESKP